MPSTTTKKDSRLEQAENEFDELERFLKNEPGVKKTKRIEKLLRYAMLYTTYAFGAVQDCTTFYKLKSNRYPDTDIIQFIKVKLKETSRLIPKGKTLFC